MAAPFFSSGACGLLLDIKSFSVISLLDNSISFTYSFIEKPAHGILKRRQKTKNWALLSVLAVFLLSSCNLIPPDTTVINNSSYNVSFQYSHEDKKIETINPNTSTSTKYFHISIIILQPEKRVKQDRDSNIITILNLPSWEVHVKNKTENPITLTADGWMDELIVPAGDFTDLPSQRGIIYTDKPQFSVVSNTFPYNIQWQFINDIFYVVISD
jgi:hypothetical protein